MFIIVVGSTAPCGAPNEQLQPTPDRSAALRASVAVRRGRAAALGGRMVIFDMFVVSGSATATAANSLSHEPVPSPLARPARQSLLERVNVDKWRETARAAQSG